MGSLRSLQKNLDKKKPFKVYKFVSHVWLRLDDSGRVYAAVIQEGPEIVFGKPILCKVNRLGGFAASIPTNDIAKACRVARDLLKYGKYQEVEFYLDEALDFGELGSKWK